MSQLSIDVIIPTYKPDKRLFTLIESLENQSVPPTNIILMNTEEKYLNNLIYGTNFRERFNNIKVVNVSRREFNHGRTRNQGAKRSKASIIVFMTQDAYPANNEMLKELIKPLADKAVAVSYGRQIPADDAGILERFTREFNYPEGDRIKSKEDIDTLGIKTYFCSNACAAYKHYVFDELGGFVNFTIFNEDMLFAAKAVNSGKKVAYASKALVIHSHNYTGMQQFHRNFDLGVSQADHPEVFEGINSEGEGIKLVKNTVKYLKDNRKLHYVPKLIYHSGCKFLGYKLGKKYKMLSKKRILKYTMSPIYWERYWDKHEIPENVYAGYGKNEEGL